MAQDTSNVSIQTLVVAVCIAVALGFLGGVIYSSVRGGSYPAQQQAGRAGSPMPPMGQGMPDGRLSPQQASAILSLEQRISANPKDADALLQLANTYFDSNNFTKAIDAYTRYEVLQPNNPNALTDLGIMYRNNGQPNEAIAAFDRAIAVDPKHVQASFNKGIVLFNDLHDSKAAIAVWQKLVDDNPGATAGDGMPVAKLIEEVKSKESSGKSGR